MELRGNVVLVSSDGLRLETERLRWDAEAQRAWTDRAGHHLPIGRRRAGHRLRVARGRGGDQRSRGGCGPSSSAARPPSEREPVAAGRP